MEKVIANKKGFRLSFTAEVRLVMLSSGKIKKKFDENSILQFKFVVLPG